jgi:hypothetical protein
MLEIAVSKAPKPRLRLRSGLLTHSKGFSSASGACFTNDLSLQANTNERKQLLKS